MKDAHFFKNVLNIACRGLQDSHHHFFSEQALTQSVKYTNLSQMNHLSS